MKPLLAFIFHLAIALLAVPMLTFFSGVMVHWVMRDVGLSAKGPQQFYSDHLFLLVAVTGLWLAYLVCDTFSSRAAAWLWIAGLLAFALRVSIWRSTGSVLFHSSVVEHFFTANCQIQTWHDVGFAERCSDKLFLMQAVVGTFGYSAGAVLYYIVKLTHRSGTVSP
ncbi:MAG: hypothetical protein ACLQBK_24775 [Candidatus Sulfotelmatobacter sp.]